MPTMDTHAVTPILIDLSHPILSGMVVPRGLPSPRIEPWISHAASRSAYGGLAEFEITRLFLVGNTGTSLDSPFHRFPGAPDVADLPLSQVAGLPGLCIDGRLDGRAVALDVAEGVVAGHAVLVRTGWDARWGTPRYEADAPFLAASAIDRLVAGGATLVGVDFGNVDDTADLARPAHTRLLAAGIPIVEHLTGLARLPTEGFRFHAAPLPIRGAAALTVRAFAEVG
jgi:arylformamidase